MLSLTLGSLVAITLLIFGAKFFKKFSSRHSNRLEQLNVRSFPSNKDSIQVLTIATELTPEAKRMIHSFNSRGFPVTVLELGCKWRGFWSKPAWFKDYLEKQAPDVNLLTILVDSYDVICAGGAEEILEKFEHKKCQVLIGAEKNCWPDPSLSKLYPSVSSSFKYLNAGVVMGYSRDLLRALSEIPAHPQKNSDDQREWTRYYIKGSKDIVLDYECDIFLNLYEVSEEEICLEENNGVGRLKVKEFGTHPVIIHGNGTSKTELQVLYSKLQHIDSWKRFS